jgi:group I intron endonuclease
MHKYGLDSFEVCELAKAESRKQLLELEKHFIKSLGTMHPKGYNLTSGGESPRFSKESRVKMSFAKKGKKLPDEVNRKIRQAQSGANHPMFGKKHSEETKAKISEANQNRIVSDETKQKISEALKGNQCHKHRKSTKGLSHFARRRLKEC